MANYADIKDILNNPTSHGLPAWDNADNQIEGVTMKAHLLNIVNTLSAGGYLFMGVIPSLTYTPSTPDANCFYLATLVGTYSNIGSPALAVAQGEVAIFKWNGTWSKEVTGINQVSVSQNTSINQNAEGITIGGVSYNIKDKLINDLVIKGLLSYTLIPNSYVNINGAIVPYNGWSRTDYIPVKYIEKLTINGGSLTYSCWYDGEKQFISTVGNSPLTPLNAEYLIVSGSDADMANLSITVNYFRGAISIDKETLVFNGEYHPIGYGSIGCGINKGTINIDFDNNKVITSLSYGYFIDCSSQWKSIVNAETQIYDSSFEGGVYIVYFNYSDSKIYCKRLNNLPTNSPIFIIGSLSYYVVSGVEKVSAIDINFDKELLRINGRKYTSVFGKKVSFMGDSITTYEGYIPAGHSAVYPTELSGAGIDSVNKTWWMQFIKNTGLKLEINESWSGTRISTSGPSGYPESSFNADSRVNNLGNPDYIFVCGGTNDFHQNQYGTDLGNYNTTDTTFDTTKFKQALQSLLYKLQWKYPNAKIYIWTPPLRKNQYIFTNNTNGWCVNDMNIAIRECADYYGATVIDVYKAMTLGRVNNETSSIYDTVHPNELGMKLIADYVTSEFLKEV